MDKISRGVWPTHDTKTSMSPTASEPVAYRLVSLLARWLFDVTTLCIRIFSYRIAMRYNKTDRDCRYRSPLEIVSTQFGNITLCFALLRAIFPKYRGNNFQ